MYLSDLPGRYNINDDQASIHTRIPGEQLSQIGVGHGRPGLKSTVDRRYRRVLLHHRQVHSGP